MAILSELIFYPIKSCAGISVAEATLTTAGLSVDALYDREWMVIDQQGQFLSQREFPRMALISPRIKTDTLELRAPGMLRLEIPLGLPDPASEQTCQVSIWDDTVLAYESDAVTNAWFSAAVGTPCRLVRFHANAIRLASAKWTGGVDAPTLFSDGFPVLLIGTASLADLNAKLRAAERDEIPMNRFRPNVVIEGIGPFEEDFADHFALGAARLKPVKPCGRCPMPSVDQASGNIGPDPLDILRTYRTRARMDDAICFGMNCIVTEGDGERLQVGQPVTFTIAF